MTAAASFEPLSALCYFRHVYDQPMFLSTTDHTLTALMVASVFLTVLSTASEIFLPVLWAAEWKAGPKREVIVEEVESA